MDNSRAGSLHRIVHERGSPMLYVELEATHGRIERWTVKLRREGGHYQWIVTDWLGTETVGDPHVPYGTELSCLAGALRFISRKARWQQNKERSVMETLEKFRGTDDTERVEQ